MPFQPLFKRPVKTYSIGFHRDDGDFQLLATLNNNDDCVAAEDFEELAQLVRTHYAKLKFENILLLPRQDAPDYVNLES